MPQLSVDGFRPHLALPLGDPSGIGAEVILKALAHSDFTPVCDLTLVGNRQLLEQRYMALRSQTTHPLADPDQLTILDLPLDPSLAAHLQLGMGNAASGELSFQWLAAAIDQAQAGQFHGIVTAPIAKSAWMAAGHAYPGQTELLAERAGVDRFGMLFVARSPHTGWILRTLLATTHIPLRQVPDALTPDLMTRKLSLLIDCLQQDFGLDTPRIAIAGLNPHSGEQGQLGREEQDWLMAWIEASQGQWPHIQLVGPVPPDTLWVNPGQAWYGPNPPDAYDAYLALYHDQGLIPVKLMAFDRAVNTSIGLPFIRTSPDHGTAFDIAPRGIADPTSFHCAVELAVELCVCRFRRLEN